MAFLFGKKKPGSRDNTGASPVGPASGSREKEKLGPSGPGPQSGIPPGPQPGAPGNLNASPGNFGPGGVGGGGGGGEKEMGLQSRGPMDQDRQVGFTPLHTLFLISHAMESCFRVRAMVGIAPMAR
jgi:hypothetical protein